MTGSKTGLHEICYSLLAIMACLALGKLASLLISGLPGSLYGMIIFTLSMRFGLIEANRVKGTVQWIIRNMGVCFVPAGVGAINYLDLLASQGIAIVSMVFITTMTLMAVIGLVAEHAHSKPTKTGAGRHD